MKEKLPQPKSSKSSGIQQYAAYSGLGFQLLFFIALGYLAGYWIDNKVPENYAFFKLILSLVGLLLALIRIIFKLMNHKD